jgi:ATP-binding cassette subfamily F protein 3
LPRPLVALEDQSAGYETHVVLEHLKLTLSPGDRIALLGRNGAGKSTFMKLLAGELTALSGTRTEARDLRIGYFAQHQLEQLSAKESPLENLRRIGAAQALRATEQELRDFLAGFGFRGGRVFEPIAPFSGGEKARLVLALITYLRPNLLLLDEPTNHLDLEMRQALAVALQEYSGAVVLVSHDRHLLRTVADEFYIVHHGRAQAFDGDLEDYAKWLADADSTVSAPLERKVETTQARKQRKREEAEGRNRLSPLRAAIANCEVELARLAQERAAVQSALEEADIYSDGAKERLRKLLEKQARLASETEKSEATWLASTEELEAQVRKLAIR